MYQLECIHLEPEKMVLWVDLMFYYLYLFCWNLQEEYLISLVMIGEDLFLHFV